MKKKKIAALLCVAMTATTLMTGCGGSTSDEPVQGTVEAESGEVQETAEEAEQETGEEAAQETAGEAGEEAAGKQEEAGNRVMGKVTAVNGNEITIALVSMGERPEGGNGEKKGMPEGKEGEKPEMPEGEEGERPEMPEGEEGERPEMPEGEEGEKPEMPEGKEGERPEGEEGKMPSDMMEETGETKTITIEDESIIVKFEGEEEVAGSLADIEVDSVISLTYDENETLTQVMVGFGRKS